MIPKQNKEPVINTDRLVRSAMNDENYCSFILDCLHNEQSKWSMDQLMKFWIDASYSDDSVEQWINRHKGTGNNHGK